MSLWEGKVLLASAGIPLLYVAVWRFGQSGRLFAWIFLALTSVSCVGLSASAIFIVPIALMIAAVPGLGRTSIKRTALILLPAIYPVACGLSLRGDFKALKPVFAYLHPTVPYVLPMVFGEKTQYVILLLLLAAPFLVRDVRLKSTISLLVLAYFLVPLNPYLFKIISKLTTPEAVWRVLWALPVAAVASVAILGAFENAKHSGGRSGAAGAAVVLLAALAYFAPHSSLAPSNGVTYSLQPLKVFEPEYELARQAIAATPPNASALVPENIAVWIPTFVRRVPLVSVREVYDEEMGAHLSPDDARARREMRELISGQVFSEAQSRLLLDKFAGYRVGLVVTQQSVGSQLLPLLVDHHFVLAHEQDGYDFFVQSEEPVRPTHSAR